MIFLSSQYIVAILPIKPSPVIVVFEPEMPELGSTIILVASARDGRNDSTADVIINNASDVNGIFMEFSKASRPSYPDKAS